MGEEKESVGGILGCLAYADRRISSPFHKCYLGFAEIFVLPFALLFNPLGVVGLTLLFGYSLVFVDRELDKTNDAEVTKVE